MISATAYRLHASLITAYNHMLFQTGKGSTGFSEYSEQRRRKESVVVKKSYPRPKAHDGAYQSGIDEPLVGSDQEFT